MNYAAEAVRHHEMAEEYRAMADATPHDGLHGLRPHYLELAEIYDRLADNEARIAHNLRIIPLR
jgi:hypothetical protein